MTKRWYAIAALVSFLVITGVLFINWLLLAGRDWIARGTFGDMFGLANAIFSGLAFAGVIITLLMQREQLRVQMKELKETGEELRKATEAQQETAGALKDQLDELIRQRKLSIMPAFTVTGGNFDRLHNLGNAAAVGVQVMGLNVEQESGEGGLLAFHPIPLVHNLSSERLHIFAPKPVDLPGGKQPSGYLISEDYELTIQFSDIEGTRYEQVIIKRGYLCTPSAVRPI